MTTSAPSDFIAVDWDTAVATARRVSGPGPRVEPDEARAAVEELRVDASRAREHVRAVTGLDPGAAPAPLLVVDRPGWVRANAASMDQVITPLMRRLQERKDPGALPSGLSGLGNSVGSKMTGLEAGSLLGYLSSKVLGQFDPFYDDEGAAGRLLLVAPNVVQVEAELQVDPSDFRLWVCLHEETHRVQFTAVPWMREHMRSQIDTFIAAADLEPSVLLSRLGEVARGVVESLRSRDEGPSLLDLVQGPEQREALERMMALMSLLEGHADVVMDAVGPDIVPSVAEIRRRFQHRRSAPRGMDRVVRRLLGMEAKLKQYREGAEFVRGVVGAVGMDGFNRVWESPETLPTADEITDPDTWVRRVHGAG